MSFDNHLNSQFSLFEKKKNWKPNTGNYVLEFLQLGLSLHVLKNWKIELVTKQDLCF